MNIKEILSEQMKACFTEKNWFVSLSDSIKELNSDQASKTSSDSTHSVKQLVIHLIFWNERFLYRFKDIPTTDMQEDNTVTFTEKSLNSNKTSWDNLSERLRNVLDEWQKELASASEEKLLKTIHNSSDTWASTISQIILHNAYHLGQIVALRKEHGNWDNKLGV